MKDTDLVRLRSIRVSLHQRNVRTGRIPDKGYLANKKYCVGSTFRVCRNWIFRSVRIQRQKGCLSMWRRSSGYCPHPLEIQSVVAAFCKVVYLLRKSDGRLKYALHQDWQPAVNPVPNVVQSLRANHKLNRCWYSENLLADSVLLLLWLVWHCVVCSIIAVLHHQKFVFPCWCGWTVECATFRYILP